MNIHKYYIGLTSAEYYPTGEFDGALMGHSFFFLCSLLFLFYSLQTYISNFIIPHTIRCAITWLTSHCVYLTSWLIHNNLLHTLLYNLLSHLWCLGLGAGAGLTYCVFVMVIHFILIHIIQNNYNSFEIRLEEHWSFIYQRCWKCWN